MNSENKIKLSNMDFESFPNQWSPGEKIFKSKYFANKSYIYSYVHMKPLLSMFMKGNEVTLTGQN